MNDTLSDEQKLLIKLKRRTRFTQFLAWLALFFTAVGIAAGYTNWLRIHERSKENSTKIENVTEQTLGFAQKKQVQILQHEVSTNFTKNIDHLNGALKELRTIQDSTQHIADSVYSQVETLTLQQEKSTGVQTASNQDWSLAEVHFLLQTANQSLVLKKDKDGALRALNLADRMLIKRGSTDLLPVRKQISKDIALLNQYALPDVNALSQLIDQLIGLLKPVVVNSDVSSVADTQESIEKTTKENVDDSIVNRVKKSFNEAVVIHKIDKSLRDEMDEETKNSLFHLISLRLETLRLMLLQGRDLSYHSQISRVKELLKSYYPEDKYKIFVAIISKLDNVTLNPALPDISGSLKLLESVKQTPIEN
ncbi:MAG: uroporphyrinogen-III C-methyltransferase [Cocleimonas sp.]